MKLPGWVQIVSVERVGIDRVIVNIEPRRWHPVYWWYAMTNWLKEHFHA